MDIPKGLVKNVTKKEIEEIVKKTLVEKILADDLGKQVKEYLENQEISKRLRIIYDRYVNPAEYKDSKELMEEGIRKVYLNKESFIRQETKNILEAILELSPDIKEEEIIHTVDNSFNITTDDFIYQLSIGEKGYHEELIEENEPGKPKTIYHLPIMGGKVKYLKFNKEHNEKVVKVLKKRGYKIVINF